MSTEIVELDVGTTRARMQVEPGGTALLLRDRSTNLVAAVFNQKGKPMPVAGHFKDDAAWRQERARHMRELMGTIASLSRAGRHRCHRTNRPGDRLRLTDRAADHDAVRLALLRDELAAMEAENVDAEKPRGRIALVPLTRKTADVVRLEFRAGDAHEYITHIAIGARQPDGTIRMIGGAALDVPVPILAGHSLRMGIRLTGGMLPEPGEKLLPPAHWRAALTEGRDDGH